MSSGLSLRWVSRAVNTEVAVSKREIICPSKIVLTNDRLDLLETTHTGDAGRWARKLKNTDLPIMV